ncbi:Hypothetical protein PHPALM_10871 [Phytophthora palmivora]|uniref:Uncharacterized protein n=1 Tax=Phytophthora palmivora TaxID=4796 RepID=A0A2P4Y3N0_9STRA|nr:Hypothetical protein PHPALM_10871 [Phytophthora palmivora]
MESVGSLDRHPSPHEYDPDDLDLDPPRRATVASASATTTERSTSVPRIRVSAMSELKEFVEKEGDGNRARAWLSKVKSAFMRDQAPDEEKCLYLYRLNVAGLRARLRIKDGPSEVRREHVEHFIETLDDSDLADHLALLRIPDADTLEEALRSRQRAKARQSKAHLETTKGSKIKVKGTKITVARRPETIVPHKIDLI